MSADNGGSVMAWEGISANGKTDLVIVPGILNSRRYIVEIVRPNVIAYLRQMGRNSLLQDDNPHRVRMVDDVLRQTRIARIVWPSLSPGLACIEHLWDIFRCVIIKRITQ